MHIKTIPQLPLACLQDLVAIQAGFGLRFGFVCRCLGFFFCYLKCILCTVKVQILTVAVLKLFTIIFTFMETQDDIDSSKNSFWLLILT